MAAAGAECTRTEQNAKLKATHLSHASLLLTFSNVCVFPQTMPLRPMMEKGKTSMGPNSNEPGSMYAIVEVVSAQAIACGWNVRCVGVWGDAWSVMLSPCNTSHSL